MKIGKKISSVFLKYYNVKIKEVVIDHNKFLGNKHNNPKIYKGFSGKLFISPFNMTFDEIDRLMLIDFEGDEAYYSIELQIFRLGDQEYPLVILYRKDNLMDIYYTNSRILENREKLIKELLTNVSFNQPDLIDFKFTIDNFGLECFLLLKDKFDRVIEFNIREHHADKKLSSILAPVGAESKNPYYFPIIYLNKFGMLSKYNTEISITIGGMKRIPSEMPVKMNGKHIYLTRYSLNPVICNWNNSDQDELSIIMASNNNDSLTQNNLTYSLIENNGFIEIQKILGEDKKNNRVYFEFSPAIPNLLALKNNIQLNGKFSCCVNDKKGIFAGKYSISNKRNKMNLNIVPTKGWQPFPGKLWLRTYKWVSEIIFQDDNRVIMESIWTKIQN